jgi:LPXTG-motif cell wall-anchored protein
LLDWLAGEGGTFCSMGWTMEQSSSIATASENHKTTIMGANDLSMIGALFIKKKKKKMK